jgi:hypothetical protein
MGIIAPQHRGPPSATLEFQPNDMLPSLVVKIKQYWGLQQNGANLGHQESSLLIQFLSERNFRTPNRQVFDSLSEQVSAGCDSQNTRRPTKKNEALWQRWWPTSNRFWVKTEVIENK